MYYMYIHVHTCTYMYIHVYTVCTCDVHTLIRIMYSINIMYDLQITNYKCIIVYILTLSS